MYEEVADLLRRQGLETATQLYAVQSQDGIYENKTNIYAILKAPRGDATEAMVLSSSWKTSRNEGLYLITFIFFEI